MKIRNPFRRRRNWQGETYKQELERRLGALEGSSTEMQLRINDIANKELWLRSQIAPVKPEPETE
jgi:hypothetical protein